VALGRVSYTTSDGGMGIAFTQIEPTNQLILEKWVEVCGTHKAAGREMIDTWRMESPANKA